MMELFDVQRDEVIKSAVITGKTTYNDALERFFPLINRFEEQRKIQRPKFYERLKKDIISGCIMPPITIAFVNEENSTNGNIVSVFDYIMNNISEGYILDGMQRLNTLSAAREDDEFNGNRVIFFNIIIAEKYDFLLYRMITLNNGQKPMTVRHQVEMLTNNLLNRMIVDNELNNITILTEKETEQNSPWGSFRKADIASAYLSFLTDSLHNQNSRFIEDKLDEILVGKVMDADLTSKTTDFSDIISEIDRLSGDQNVKSWLKLENNLIGFALGAKHQFNDVSATSISEFSAAIETFEEAFKAINPSKVNVGKFRRELSNYFVENISRLKSEPEETFVEEFFSFTAT